MTSQDKTAAELVANVRTLLTLPDVYLRVKEVVEVPDSYQGEWVNAISVDPGTTARLLRVVNTTVGRPLQDVEPEAPTQYEVVWP